MQQQSRGLPRRLIQLAIGLALFGFGVSLMIRADLGVASWDVLSQGVIRYVPLSFGAITIITSALVLLLWIPLKQRLGIGTVGNAILIGVFADVGLALLPELDHFWLRLGVLLLGIFVIGLASGIYIGARLGPGPRDGLMTGLHEVTGWPIWIVRTLLEATVVIIGWLLGGTVGIGTVLFAVLIGPLCQVFIPIFDTRAVVTSTENSPAAETPPAETPHTETPTA